MGHSDSGKGTYQVLRNLETRSQYYYKLAGAMFGLGLPGLGYDCFRTWELLTMGSIVVTERGVGYDRTVSTVPVVCLLWVSECEGYSNAAAVVVLEAAGAAAGRLQRYKREAAAGGVPAGPVLLQGVRVRATEAVLVVWHHRQCLGVQVPPRAPGEVSHGGRGQGIHTAVREVSMWGDGHLRCRDEEDS